jgi:hypothetical protein
MIKKGMIFLLALSFFCIAAQKPATGDHMILTAGGRVLEELFKNQKNYYDHYIGNKPDFKAIIAFASGGRQRLYANQHFSLEKPGIYILLEGFSPSTGHYTGMVLCDDHAVAYRNTASTGWKFWQIDHNSNDSLERLTFIGRNIIDKVAHWDTAYINELKRSVGNTVSDGFNFMASRIDNHIPSALVIHTISFYEFPDRP